MKMITRLLLTIVATVSTLFAISQKQTFEAKDGTSVQVEAISINPDEGRHTAVFAGIFGPEGLQVLGASYYKPTSFYLSAMIGPTGGIVDGSFFLTSKLKESSIKQSLKSTGNTTYVARLPLEKRKSFGLHAGTNYYDNATYSEVEGNTYTANGIFGGVTFLSSKHTHWRIFDNLKEAQGSTIGRLNADVVYYIKRKLVEGKYADDAGIDDISRKVGFRVYFDGKTTSWGRRGRTSIHYMLGVGLNSDKRSQLPVFGGLGMGYSFL